MSHRPSYFYCRYAIRRLQYFQDLVKHDRGREDTEDAKPLKELLPKNIPENKHRIAIDRQINKLIPSIEDVLLKAHINTGIVSQRAEQEFNYDKIRIEYKKVEEEYDSISNYFEIPHTYDAHRLLMQALERGIGFYEDRQRGALLDLINPLAWIAWFIRLPFWILGRAGMEDKNIVVDLYKWLIRIIMFVILAFIMTKLGISIPWAELIKLIKG